LNSTDTLLFFFLGKEVVKKGKEKKGDKKVAVAPSAKPGPKPIADVQSFLEIAETSRSSLALQGHSSLTHLYIDT
jgi:hypothetical protein